MSYKIVKKTLSGKVIMLMETGILSEDSANKRAIELDIEMKENNACKMIDGIPQCKHVVKKER
jgi:hypothetical protein